jgi:hypothetical protein
VSHSRIPLWRPVFHAESAGNTERSIVHRSNSDEWQKTKKSPLTTCRCAAWVADSAFDGATRLQAHWPRRLNNDSAAPRLPPHGLRLADERAESCNSSQERIRYGILSTIPDIEPFCEFPDRCLEQTARQAGYTKPRRWLTCAGFTDPACNFPIPFQ